MIKLHKIIATFFGLGFAPFAPGTFGALGGMLIAYLLQQQNLSFLTFQLIIFTLILLFTILGTISTTALETEWGKDPGKIVVDEAVGLWISILWTPFGWLPLVLGFGLFRLFDILKPFGIKKLEEIQGGFGVMADDILAGLYAAICLQLILYFLP